MAIKINGISADLLSKINGLGINVQVISTGLLLDDYPNAAVAYSFRNIKSGIINVLRVRRASDDNEADFTVTEITDGTLTTWLDGANGYLVTSIDVLGSRNATQSIISAQPLIAIDGIPITHNGALFAQGGTVESAYSSTSYLDGDCMVFLVFKSHTAASFRGIFSEEESDTSHEIAILQDTRGGTRSRIYYRPDGTLVGLGDSNTLPDTLMLITYVKNASEISLYVNGTFINSTTVTTNFANNVRLILGGATSGFSSDGKFSELIIYPFFNNTNRPLIENEINKYYIIYPDTEVSGLLYDYPGASAAYSLRQLTIYQNGYKEKLIRVRRSSDGAETDVFADTNYELSLNSLTSDGSTTFGDWIGSDDGFVVTWYDQSGNNYNAYQSVSTRQPILVNAGVLVTKSGIPALQLNGGQYFSQVNTNVDNAVNPIDHFIVGSFIGDSYLIGTGGGTFDLTLKVAGGQYNVANGNTGVYQIDGQTSILWARRFNGTNNGRFSLNNGSDSIFTHDVRPIYYTRLFSYSNSFAGNSPVGYAHEVIQYDTDILSVKNDIVSALNSYYGIY